MVLNGCEIDEVIIEGNEKVVIKLKSGMVIVVKPDIRKVRDINAVYSGSEAVDVKVDELDDKTYDLCRNQSLLEILIRSEKKNMKVVEQV
jgi:hypothetical protein